MRYMGIDYGKKRVGIAFSDESGSMAFPHATIANTDKLIAKIEELINEKDVKEIVVGHSVDMKGRDNAIQTAINEFILDLTLAVGLPIHLEPEWFTTGEATRFQGKNALKDASAAAIILNSFLQRKV